MASPDLGPTPASSPKERNLAYNFFLAQLEKVKSGRIKRYDLMTLSRDWEGKIDLFTPAQRVKDGVKLFSDTGVNAGVQRIFSQLTGEVDGWAVVNGIAQDKPDKRDTGNSHYDVLSWIIPTVQDGVNIGVDKVVDDRGVWSETYYLTHSKQDKPAPQEKTPWPIRKAASLVSLGEFIRLRYKPGLGVSNQEGKQLLAVVNLLEATSGYKRDLPFSADPRLIAARKIIKRVPLEQYLAARKAIAVRELEENTQEEMVFSALRGMEEWAAESAKRKEQWVAELDLVHKAAWAAGIVLDPRKHETVAVVA